MPATTIVSNAPNTLANFADINGLLSGVRWTSAAITYSFPSLASAYDPAYGNEAATFGALATATQTVVSTQILTQYAAVSGLTFALATSTDPGTLRYADSDFSQTAGAYYPSDYFTGAGGDVWVRGSGSVGAQFNNPVKGDYAFFTLLHETGHALGLKHGHQQLVLNGAVRDALPGPHDSMEYSVMTYRSFVDGPTGGSYSNGQFDYAQTLMQDDVAAIQYMYGANYGINSSDSIYRWNTSTGEMSINNALQGAPGASKVFMNIWDGGGVDTYDLSDRTADMSIDLRAGGWVNFGTQLADLGLGHVAIGNVSNSLLYQGNTASLIENATGGSGNDTITGNEVANVLNGGAGNNTLRGGAGNDTLIGGTGSDQMYGGTGVDSFSGGDATDALYIDHEDLSVNLLGGAGFDYIIVEDASGVNVTLTDANSIEIAIGDTGNDTVNASATTNTTQYLYGRGGNDILTLGALSGSIYGEDGNDTLTGGGGNDVISGGAGADRLSGGAGSDSLFFDSADLAVVGGLGFDIAYAEGATTFTFASGSDIEVVIGSIGNDVLNASAVSTLMYIYGGAGGDTLTQGSAGGALYGEAGADTLNGGSSGEIIFGGDDNDNLYGNGGNDVLIGGAGADVLDGGDGADSLVFNSGDTVIGGAGTDYAYVDGAAAVTASFGSASGVEIVIGGAGNDVLNAIAADTVMYIYGGGGDDILTQGTAGGALYGEGGNDTLFGGAGNDTLFGGSDNDVVHAGNGIDILLGGTGADTFYFDGGTGYDNVYDFSHAEGDIINVQALGITSIAGLAIDQSGIWAHVTGTGLDVYVNNGGTALVIADFQF
jgi:serralysin